MTMTTSKTSTTSTISTNSSVSSTRTKKKTNSSNKSNQKKKVDFESEMYVLPSKRCKLRVDPHTRAISTDSLTLRLRRWTFISMINLPLKLHDQCVTKKEFVVIGILAHKIFKQSKNDTKYLILKLDDFKASISVFIFDSNIIEHFFKIQPGTVLVLAAPTVLSDSSKNTDKFSNRGKALKKARTDISLKIDDFEQILVVGKSLDFAICPRVNAASGERCTEAIDKSRFDLCEFHRAKQYKKFAAKRNDTNRTTMSRLRNPQCSKRSLSGNMNGLNGLSMANRRRGPTSTRTRSVRKKRETVDHELNRRQNRDLLMSSSALRRTSVLGRRLQKYSKGGKNVRAAQSARKAKTVKKLLAGKTLIPHLGTTPSKGSGMSGNNGLILIGGPSMSLKTSGTSKTERNARRKRSFEEFMAASNDKENVFETSPVKKMKKMSSEVLQVKSENVNFEVREVVEESATWEAVTVYVCKFGGCGLKDRVMERMNSFCEGHAMNVVSTRGKKYFWECTHCGNTTTTLNTKKHRKNCKCGKKEYYVPTTKERVANPKLKNTEESFQLG